MIIYDINDNVVTNPDLTIGYVVKEIRIKKDAIPIDNVEKFAWADDDYEEVLRYLEIPEEERINNKISSLKKELYETDYIIAKVVEGVSTWDDYPNIKEKRQAWRDEINKLESDLKRLKQQ